MTSFTLRALSVLAFPLFLGACGGSGSSGGEPGPAPLEKPQPTQAGSVFLDHSQLSTNPVRINDDLFVVTVGNQVYFVSYAGEIKHTFDAFNKVIAPPIVFEDRVIVMTEAGIVNYLDLKAQQTASFGAPHDTIFPGAVFPDGTLAFLCLDRNVYFLDRNGLLKTKVPVVSGMARTPIVRGDELFYNDLSAGLKVFNSSGVLLRTLDVGNLPSEPFLRQDGVLVYFDRTLGKIWAILTDGDIKSHDLPGLKVQSRPHVFDDGTVLLTTEDGQIVALDDDLVEVGRFKEVANNRGMSAPVPVAPGVSVVLGVNAVYFVDQKNASILETVDYPGDLSQGRSFLYLPLITNDGTVIFSVREGTGTRIHFLKRGQFL